MFSKLNILKNKIAQISTPLLKTKAGKILLDEFGSNDNTLPLDNDEDSRFMIILVGLMCFLAVLACSGAFALHNMTERWTTGLENKVTIEVRSETKDGHLLSQDTVTKETEKLRKSLEGNPLIKSIEVLSHHDVQDLISPWIGENFILEDIPLPGLIALELNRSDKESLNKLKENIESISEYATLETHHEWLSDLVHFAGTLKTLALIISLIIGAATILTIVIGMHTRMAIHKKEVDLLHAIGASDLFIARQFQKHALMISSRGAILGTIIGIIATLLVALITSSSQTQLIPNIQIGAGAIITLCLIPILAIIIATVTSRITVLRSLLQMP